MSLEACVELVRTADPDRYEVTILAPEEVQKILWPLYAFNVEVSRAPWVTQEPMIAEIRLQWWRDALEEIREGKVVRAHDVTKPLAAILDAEGAISLDRLVEARIWDIYSDPFRDQAAFDRYIDATYGDLLWTAARLIAPESDEAVVRSFAFGCGVASMLRARAALKALHKNPLPDDTLVGFQQVSRAGISAFHRAKRDKRKLPKVLNTLLISGWQAAPTFAQIERAPEQIFEDGFAPSEFLRRWRIFKLSCFGWWR
ncbi:MAG: squalene/phytoene synthase family protein [Pseudomonadota bacterium]